MARRIGRLQGKGDFSKFLSRIPAAAQAEVVDFLDTSGKRLLGNAQAEVPVRPGGGALKAALSFRVFAKSLRLKIGLLGKAVNKRLFYGYILDAGRRAQRVRIRRGPRAGQYMNVRGIGRDRYNFVFGRRRDFEATDLPKLRTLFDRILKRAGG